MVARGARNIWSIVCLHSSSVCEMVESALRRVWSTLSERLPTVAKRAEELSRVSPIRVFVVSPVAPRGVLEEHGILWVVERARREGFAGVQIGLDVVVVSEDEEEAAVTAAEELLHAVLSTSELALRLAVAQVLAEKGVRPTQLDEWLAEELLVKRILAEAGLLAPGELEEEARRYMELYRAETGTQPPLSLEDVDRILAELRDTLRVV